MPLLVAHLLCRLTISAGVGLVSAVSAILSRLTRIEHGPSVVCVCVCVCVYVEGGEFEREKNNREAMPITLINQKLKGLCPLHKLYIQRKWNITQ